MISNPLFKHTKQIEYGEHWGDVLVNIAGPLLIQRKKIAVEIANSISKKT